jgi:adenosyl cobinamide kinase/adenosyl cobinamide phosphate guanylyltransferase
MGKQYDAADTPMEAARRAREWRIRHQAFQIAAQMPENEVEALRILECVHELLQWGIMQKPALGTVQRLFNDPN